MFSVLTNILCCDETKDIYRYKLCGGGVEVVIYSLGGVIQSILAPNNQGEVVDVTLGYDTPQGWLLLQFQTR